jgi:hypothetical protein
VELDRFNRVAFEPVTTSAQAGGHPPAQWSAGIQEWKVE